MPSGTQRSFVRALILVVPLAAVVAFVLASVAKPPKPSVKAEKPGLAINHIRVVIDTSASMAGYFGGKTEFKDYLAKLIADLPHQLGASGLHPEIGYAFADSGHTLNAYTGTADELMRDVLNNKVPAGGSSMLQDVLDEISRTIGGDEVDLLLTDAIFSHTNAEIKQNPEVNKNDIEQIAAKVQVAFQHPDWTGKKKVKPGLAILQYLSQFHGTYYSYKNDKLPCCAASRPFYVWIIGDASRVARTFTLVRRIAEPAHSILLGQNSLDVEPRVLNYSNRSGTWRKARHQDLTLIKVPAQGEAQVTVALNLKDMPNDGVVRDHVLKNLKIDANFVTVTAKDFFTRAQMQPKFHPLDASDLTNATHFVVLSVGGLALPSADVTIELRNALPAWCREATVDDDMATAAADAPPRTFGFLPIVNGAARALGATDPLFTIKLTLQR